MAHADAQTQPDAIWLNARLATFAADRPGIGAIERGALAARDGRLVFVGPEAELPVDWRDGAPTIDCEGRWITPGFIDCHTHLVYAGDRAHEFELRLAGASYETIARERRRHRRHRRRRPARRAKTSWCASRCRGSTR